MANPKHATSAKDSLILGGYDYGDVEVVPVETGLDNELCEIMYSEEYKRLIGLLRGLMGLSESSERALKLTEMFITTCPAYYTAWNYRFNIVKELFGKDPEKLNKELDWLDEFTLSNPKNYQIWSYRQALLELHPAPQFSRELPVLQMMLDEDSKNYHVWSYRRWAVVYFGDFSHELKFADGFIESDVYNNSAWSHRMFVFKYTGIGAKDFNDEINYVKEKISYAPQNLSAWNYLQGLYERFRDGVLEESTVNFALNHLNGFFEASSNDEPRELDSSYALEFVAEHYSCKQETQDKAVKAFEALRTTYDPIRSKYWEYKLKGLA